MKRKTQLLFAAAVMVVLTAMTAMADSRESINKVSLTVTSLISAGTSGTEVQIVPEDTEKYWVDSYEILNPPEDRWTQYDSPRVEVHLIASDDYYFKSHSKSNVNLKGSDVYQFVSAKRQDSNTYMIVTFDLKPTGGKLGNPAEAYWGSNCKAQWTKAYKAAQYDVELYNDEKRVKSVTTTASSYDFSEYMKEETDYYFKVRSYKKENSKTTLRGNWITSDYYDHYEMTNSNKTSTSTTTVSSGGPGTSAQGQWRQDVNGWWYQNADGTWPASAWSLINGVWYYFGDNGYMRTGWQDIGGKWYCLAENGALYVGTTTPDGYTVDQNGAWIQ